MTDSGTVKMCVFARGRERQSKCFLIEGYDLVGFHPIEGPRFSGNPLKGQKHQATRCSAAATKTPYGRIQQSTNTLKIP